MQILESKFVGRKFEFQKKKRSQKKTRRSRLKVSSLSKLQELFKKQKRIA